MTYMTYEHPDSFLNSLTESLISRLNTLYPQPYPAMFNPCHEALDLHLTLLTVLHKGRSQQDHKYRLRLCAAHPVVVWLNRVPGNVYSRYPSWCLYRFPSNLGPAPSENNLSAMTWQLGLFRDDLLVKQN